MDDLRACCLYLHHPKLVPQEVLVVNKVIAYLDEHSDIPYCDI